MMVSKRLFEAIEPEASCYTKKSSASTLTCSLIVSTDSLPQNILEEDFALSNTESECEKTGKKKGKRPKRRLASSNIKELLNFTEESS
jgi:hypothetical protein